jgi:hypothetical protein
MQASEGCGVKTKRPARANGKGASAPAASSLPEGCIARVPLESMFGQIDQRLAQHGAFLRRILLALDVDPDKEGLT